MQWFLAGDGKWGEAGARVALFVRSYGLPLTGKGSELAGYSSARHVPSRSLMGRNGWNFGEGHGGNNAEQ